MNDLFFGVGIQVDIKNPDNFLKIAETLTRIGIASKDKTKLYQSCHILHKKDKQGISRYAIVHFKEMFVLDRKHTVIQEEDYDRRFYVCRMLQDWGLLDILDIEETPLQKPNIMVISYKDKSNWELIPKYTIGNKNGNY